MKEIAPGIFQNTCCYSLHFYRESEDEYRESVYSDDLAALRAFAKGPDISSAYIRHAASGDDMSLTKAKKIRKEFRQPGSNIWYMSKQEITRVVGVEVQYFCYVDLAWDIFTGCRPQSLPELEYQEVSLDFLFSKGIQFPDYTSEEYKTSLISSLV